MKTVLLLGRAKRLAPLFGELAKSLRSNHRVVITLGMAFQPVTREDFGLKENEKNIHSFLLCEEIKTRYAEFKKSGQPAGPFLEAIEKELGLNFYQSACNYLSYRRFAKQYYGTFPVRSYENEEESIEEFIGSYLFFKEIFQKYQPNTAFCEIPDQISHRIAAALAHKAGIFLTGIFLSSTFGKGRALLTSGTNRKSVLLDHYYSHPELLSPNALISAKEILKSYHSSEIVEEEFVGELRAKSQKSALSRLLAKDPRSLLKSGSSKISKQIALVKNLQWLKRHFKNDLPKPPFVLFCLHHQPEASSSLVAPRWIDQDRIVEQLAMMAPAGIKIVVKENPRTYGLRGKSYFEYMTKFPNVHLLNPGFSQSTAIRKAAAVLTISGTVGLEAILMRKKVGVLSSCFYSIYHGARTLQFPEEIFQHMKDPSWKPEEREEDLLNFTAAAIEATFYVGDQKQLRWPPPQVAGLSIAKGMELFLDTVENQVLKPDDFSIQM